MRYDKPKCPDCQEFLLGEVDFVPGRAEVVCVENDVFEYTGTTEVFWDGQLNELDLLYPERVDQTTILVECAAGHTWTTSKFPE